jgi:hypothetical protein
MPGAIPETPRGMRKYHNTGAACATAFISQRKSAARNDPNAAPADLNFPLDFGALSPP